MLFSSSKEQIHERRQRIIDGKHHGIDVGLSADGGATAFAPHESANPRYHALCLCRSVFIRLIKLSTRTADSGNYSANTPIAYGAFAEAIRIWQISKVSATLTMVPLITIIATEILHSLAPQLIAAPELNGLAYCGAAIVISGALLAVSAKSAQKNT